MNILIVEDDPIMADALSMTLTQAGYFNVIARTIEGVLNEIQHNHIDGVLLDINLPDGDGTRLARLIRKNHVPVPILVVSGNNTVDDRITALGAGADGYLTKPFDRYELLAHLEAILRRTHGHSAAQITVGNMLIDLNKNQVTVARKNVSLTQKEYQILHLLGLRKGATLSKEVFLAHLYGGFDEPESKIIDVFMCKLRKKLTKAGLQDAEIQTIWGQGYVLRDSNTENVVMLNEAVS